jgi:hypothetical protein
MRQGQVVVFGGDDQVEMSVAQLGILKLHDQSVAARPVTHAQ